VQLDKAQQYAESAVTATANDLRNTELEQLTEGDLSNVSSLAAYWDTLGWVHFRKAISIRPKNMFLPRGPRAI